MLKTADFWKYASNLNKNTTLDNAFIKWANKSKMSLKDAQILWDDINKEVLAFFSKNKKADNVTVNITGDKDDVKDFLEEGEGVSPVKSEEEIESMTVEKPEEKPKETSLLGGLEEEEEEEEGMPAAPETAAPEAGAPGAGGELPPLPA